jgi:glycosyltransferase involved in cell wall biosynthesis
VYYQRLAAMFLDQGYAVAVVSENRTGDFRGRYYGLLPIRSGRARNTGRDVLSYAIQNAMYFRIFGAIRREAPQSILVHTSFLNKIGAFYPFLRVARRLFPDARLVADVRDRQLPAKWLYKLRIFDGIVACSANVEAHLGQDPELLGKIVRIPVIQEPLAPTPTDVRTALAREGLAGTAYALHVGSVREDKSVGLLLEAFRDYVSVMDPGLILVLVGLIKTTDRRLTAMLSGPNIRYLGARPRADAIALMAGASVCVNISPNEGMPRSSLEALALQRPVVLPPNVPELESLGARYIAATRDPKRIAEMILDAVRSCAPPRYPIEEHYPDRVIAAYNRVLGFSRD